MRISLGQLRKIIKEETTRVRLSEGTDASTTDGKRFRGRFVSPQMMAVYKATEEALSASGGVITDVVRDAAEETGLANNCDLDELEELVFFLDDNIGKKMQERPEPTSVPQWARGRIKSGARPARTFRYFSV